MAPRISRYGRKLFMSSKADQATTDTCLLFFTNGRIAHAWEKGYYKFLTWNFIDPSDRHRYTDEESDEE